MPISYLWGRQCNQAGQGRARHGLSAEMALRIEKVFGVKMETLMRMQSAFDIARTRSREKEIRGIRRFHRADAHPQ